MIRENATTLRERVIGDLRREGYRFREIAELLGISKQRASKIAGRMIVRVNVARMKKHHRAVNWRKSQFVRGITDDEFARRLETVNRNFEARFDSILNQTYKRRGFLDKCAEAPRYTLFTKLWPLIELYGKRPFSFSKIVRDFPRLAKEPHLSQLLFRLRKTGLLEKVGSTRAEGHNRPEVLMVERPIEQIAAGRIEEVVVRWSKKLNQLRRDYQTTRPVQPIQSLRRSLIGNLMEEGFSTTEIQSIFRVRLVPTQTPKVRDSRASEKSLGLGRFGRPSDKAAQPRTSVR